MRATQTRGRYSPRKCIMLYTRPSWWWDDVLCRVHDGCGDGIRTRVILRQRAISEMRLDAVAGRLSLPCLFVAVTRFIPLKRMYARLCVPKSSVHAQRTHTHDLAEDDARSVFRAEKTRFSHIFIVFGRKFDRELSRARTPWNWLVGHRQSLSSQEERGTRDF